MCQLMDHRHAACGKGFVLELSCRNHACRITAEQQSLSSHPAASSTSQSGITCHKLQKDRFCFQTRHLVTLIEHGRFVCLTFVILLIESDTL